MSDGLPSFPYHPYNIPDDKGLVDTTPVKPGVATVDHSRKLAKDITKLARLKHPKMKMPKMKRKSDIRYY